VLFVVSTATMTPTEEWQNEDYLSLSDADNDNLAKEEVSGDEEEEAESALVSIPVDRELTSKRSKSLEKQGPTSSKRSRENTPLSPISTHAHPRPPWMSAPLQLHSRVNGDRSYLYDRFFDSSRIHPLVLLHNEIVAFTKLMQYQPSELLQREEIIKEVKVIVQSCFGKTTTKGNVQSIDDDSTFPQVKVFGSQASGLFLPASDIDLVVLLNPGSSSDEASPPTDGDTNGSSAVDAATMWEQEVSRRSPLRTLADAFRRKWPDELSYLEVIENTRVPLVKFTYAPYNINVDICIDQKSGPGMFFAVSCFAIDSLPRC
jgi:Nucleotidyltransferase domain